MKRLKLVGKDAGTVDSQKIYPQDLSALSRDEVDSGNVDRQLVSSTLFDSGDDAMNASDP